MAQPGEATPASPADASAEAADAPAPPPDDAALAAFLGSDGEEHDGDAAAGSDGDAAPSLPRSGLLARRLAAVRRLHAAYARQYTVLAAAAAKGEAKGRKRQRAAGCPPALDPGPTDADSEAPCAAPGASVDAALTSGAPAGWRGAARRAAPRLARLEAAAARAAEADMDRAGALATLVGPKAHFLVRAPTVVVGRGVGGDAASSAPSPIDIDLAAAGPASKASRVQARLELGPDGGFVVTNLGRRTLAVDGAPLVAGGSARLRPLALLEAGDARLLFVPNGRAVARAVARSSALAL